MYFIATSFFIRRLNMNHLIVNNPAAMVIRISLLILAFLTASMVIGAEKQATITPDEIVAELKTKLDLNQQQVKELTTALTELAQQLDALIAKREAAKDDEDPNEFILGVKQAQADYQKKLKTILSSS